SISVPANSSKTVTLRGDLIDGVVSGALHQFQLLSVDTSASLSGLPLTGNTFTVGTQNVSTITAAAATAPSNPSLGAKAAEIATFRLTAGTEDIEFNQLVLTFTGSLARAQVTNLKLYQESTMLASASSISSEDTVTFTLASPYTITDGQNKTFKVKADLGGEVNETLTTRIEEAGHLYAVDKQYNYGTRFTTGVPLTLATVTLQGGTLTFADNGPVAGEIGKNLQDVVLTTFAITAERDVEVRRLDVNFCISTGADIAPGTTTISDLRIKDADTGTTLMSQSSLATAATSETDSTSLTITAFSEACGTPNIYRLTDIFNLKAGVTKNLQVTIDTGTSNTLDSRFARASVSETWYDADQSYFRDTTTGDYLFTADVIPNSVTGDNQTITAASVTPSLASTPVTALQYVIGASKIEGVGVVYTASDASAITLKQIGVRVYRNTAVLFAEGTEDASPQGEITSAYLYDGTTLLSTKTLSATAATGAHDYGTATFDNLTVTVSKGSNKKLVVKFDVDSSATAGYVAIGVPASAISAYDADGNDISSDVTVDINLVTAGTTPGRYAQVLAAGSLTVAADASSPDSDIVISGENDVVISKIKFTANDENWTVADLRVNLNTTANEGSIEAVKIAFPGGTATGFLAGGFVNFTGLAWTIEKDTEEILTISADLAVINPSIAETGREIQLGIDFDTGFEANGASQTQITTFGSADVFGNAQYLRKTQPTVTGLVLPSTTLINGTQVISTFSVAANAKGDVWLKKFSWDINVSDITNVTSWALYQTGSSTAITGFWSDGTTTSTTGAVPLDNQAAVLEVELDTEEAVAAGTTKTFELKGVVTGASTADSISASLLNDDNDTVVATGGLIDHATEGVRLDLSTDRAVDFLWSDKARGVDHTDSYQNTFLDWTNGYLLDTLPTPTKALTWPS
ncbi:hypothetical protein MYX06_05205, partial [Patescibacteria group bacterium AH-259-L05]|nr:hypothetical protein [Patescibacteria group bacterium AH-259-L05]